MEITETREISTYAYKNDPGATSEDRFGPALREMGGPAGGAETEGSGGGQAAIREMLTWTLPQGWTEAPADGSGMRLIDARFGPNQEGECYVSIMPGAAGGLEANLNRWRTQMGQPPYSAEEIEALPKRKIFNRDGIYAAFDGEYKNVGADKALPDYRLEGVIHSAPQATIFVKMVGPKNLVLENAQAFEAFCQSIAPKQ
jgi:hypothetical protein